MGNNAFSEVMSKSRNSRNRSMGMSDAIAVGPIAERNRIAAPGTS